MLRFILQRLLIIPLALILVIVLTYAYAHFVQWDYASRYPQLYYILSVTQERPREFAPAFKTYLNDLRSGSLGTLRNGENIGLVLQKAGIASLGLLAVALGVSIPLGVLLGISASNWKSKRPACWLTLGATAGLAMPSFYIGSLLILFSVAYVLIIPRQNGIPFPLAGFGWDRHMILPTLSLMLRPTMQIAQVTATMLTTELSKPYIAAARSVGHRWRTVKQRLAFRNVLAPITLTVAGALRTLVTDLVLVEWMFFWPGLGRFLAYALIPAARTNRANSPYLLDPAFTTAMLASITLLFLSADFIAAVFVRIFDPRLRVPVAEEVPGV